MLFPIGYKKFTLVDQVPVGQHRPILPGFIEMLAAQIQIIESRHYITEPLKEARMAADQDLDCQDDDVAVRFLLIVKMILWSEE